MSIKFVCSCGKRLKARDDMAARRILCPRCGNPVGVPSLDPNQPTPMTPAERLRNQARRPIALSHLDDAPAAPEAKVERSRVREEARKPTPMPPTPSRDREGVGLSGSLPHGRGSERSSDALSLPSLPPTPSRDREGVESSPLPHGRGSEARAQLAVAPTRPIDPTSIRQKLNRKPHNRFRSRFDWPLETYWYECRRYPFRAWPLILAMTFALTVLTAFGVLAVPRILSDLTFDAVTLGFTLVCLIGPLLMLGYVCGFLDCVLASALAGESRHVRWPGSNLGLVFRSLVTWVFAFLSAPAPLAFLGLYYWLYCGDATWVDYVILVELAILGTGYWLLAVVAVSRSERLRDANPWRVAELAERLGWRALAGTLLAGALFLWHGLWALWVAGMLHDKPVLGLLMAACCWLSWLVWATFVFRVVGLWCYYRRI